MRKYILAGAGSFLIALSIFVSSWSPSAGKQAIKHTTAVATTTAAVSEETLYHNYLQNLYVKANLAAAGLDQMVFNKAVTGYYNLKNAGKLSSKKSIISIADMNMSSKTKRLWVIDLDKMEVLLNTWVAHGKNTGDDIATKFSNVNSSYQSSLGFYVTGEVYVGKHGRSLKLDGMDQGYNDNARERAIVIHGASYVGQGTINALGRLGRSQGCPAVAPELSDKVINTIEGKTVLFINGADQKYTSKYLDGDLAAAYATNQTQEKVKQAKSTASLLPAQPLKVGI
jgi:hypothetical protein